MTYSIMMKLRYGGTATIVANTLAEANRIVECISGETAGEFAGWATVIDPAGYKHGVNMADVVAFDVVPR